MPFFRVMLLGENFRLEMDGEVEHLGFYTTRFVEAADETEAEQAAVDLIRQDETLRPRVRNERDDTPMLYAEKIVELDAMPEDRPNQGFTFFPDDSGES